MKMKKILIAFLVLIVMLSSISLIGCKDDTSSETPNDEQLNIIDDNYRNWYEVFVRSYFDSNNDGLGDLKGLEQKLDYIKEIRKPTPIVCDDCGLKERCRYSCACLNKQCTGNIGEISPFQCSFERLQISCADKAAEILYKKGNTKFLKKQYGEFYNLIEI